MYKKRILIFLLVFIMSLKLVIAEEQANDFNGYSNLEFDFRLYGSFTLESTSSKGKISEVASFLTFFPREDFTQEVKSLKFDSNPPAVISKDKDEVSFTWNAPKEGAFNLNVNSKVNTKNAIIIVDEKIDFPLKNVETFYTEPTQFIDITDDIKLKAKELAANEDDLYAVSFKVAEWIENNIKYDLSTLTADVVQKSSWVLKNKEGVCDELTNLFISMMRSLGVPARYVSGVAYTNVGYRFGPHAWAEVYFPDKGWVPFDITYKQLGWVDPGHVKLKISADSGDPTIRYTWKSVDTNIKGKKIDIDTSVTSKGNRIVSPINVEVKPLVSGAGPGSYIPFEVVVRNNNNYYFPLFISVTKANSLIDKNYKSILLKPGETKKLFWTSIIPDNLESGYIYKSTFEVEDQFHSAYNSNITYSSNLKTITKEEAARLISLEDNKVFTSQLSLACSSTEHIFTYEAPSLRCRVKNQASMRLNELKVCAGSVCKSSSLDVDEEKELELKLPSLKEGINNVDVTAEANNIKAKDSVSVEVLANPDLVISDILYSQEVSYGEDLDFDLVLNVKSPVNDVKISLNNIEVLKLDSLKGSKKVSLIADSKQLLNKDAINLKLDFKDKNSKNYSIAKEYPVKVINVPFFVRLVNWFRA